MPWKDPEKRNAYYRRYYKTSKGRANSIAQKQKKRDWLRELKRGLSCIRCGYNENPVALQFHHRDPKLKIMAVTTMIERRPLPEVLKEIAKCDVLCANCHAIETWA